MASRPLTACATPGCPELTDRDRCDEHRRANDRRRSSSTTRGYDRQWRKVRLRVMRERGWRCEECGVRPADTSKLHGHHRKPLGDGGARLDPSNVIVLCDGCHNALVEHRPNGNRNLSGPPSSVDRGGARISIAKGS